MADNRVTMTIKLTPGKDDALIQWWESLQKGDYTAQGESRQFTAKQILRRGLSIPEETVQPIADADSLNRIAELESWIQKIAQDLPSYVQNEIGKALATGAPLPTTQIQGGAQLDQQAIEKREKRLKNSSW